MKHSHRPGVAASEAALSSPAEWSVQRSEELAASSDLARKGLVAWSDVARKGLAAWSNVARNGPGVLSDVARNELAARSDVTRSERAAWSDVARSGPAALSDVARNELMASSDLARKHVVSCNSGPALDRPARRAAPFAAAHRARGFTLVEALVALVILSVGLLGVGHLTLSALRESSFALARTRAVYLLSDMLERIRANPDAEDAYDCASYVGGPREHGCAPSGAPARPCTARELAEDDLARWQALARDSLTLAGPGTCDANVAYLAATANGEPARYRLELSWTERGSPAPITLTQELAVVSGRSS